MRSRSLQLLLLLPVSVLTVVSVAGNQSGHLRQLFDELDCDNDGQLRKQELRQRIGQLSPDHMSHSALEQAVDGALGRLDSPDGGLSVSWREFQQHLHTILQVRIASHRSTCTCKPVLALLICSFTVFPSELPPGLLACTYHLQGVAVDDWVAHGLRLPQYAEAFRANAVTVGW